MFADEGRAHLKQLYAQSLAPDLMRARKHAIPARAGEQVYWTWSAARTCIRATTIGLTQA